MSASRRRATPLVRLVRIAAPALGLVWLVLSLVLRAAVAAPQQKSDGPRIATPSPRTGGASNGKASPQQVSVGLYLQNIPEIDIKTNSFSAEFYLWFVWKGDIDPTLTWELTNVVSYTELAKLPVFVDAEGNSAPDTLPDGSHLQQFHVYGRFGVPFPLGRYPFDNHEILISLEDARHASDALTHVIDVAGTARRPDLQIPGWTLGPIRTEHTRAQFATNFGDTRVQHSEAYSRVEFRVHIDRPIVGIVSKTVIPIALIILITFGAFFCQPSDIDARLCLTITALISAVAMQLTATAELPPTGSLLLLDKIYLHSYVAILAVTFLSIAANRAVHGDRPERAARIDRIGLWLTAGGYFGGLALFMIGAR